MELDYFFGQYMQIIKHDFALVTSDRQKIVRVDFFYLRAADTNLFLIKEHFPSSFIFPIFIYLIFLHLKSIELIYL